MHASDEAIKLCAVESPTSDGDSGRGGLPFWPPSELKFHPIASRSLANRDRRGCVTLGGGESDKSDHSSSS